MKLKRFLPKLTTNSTAGKYKVKQSKNMMETRLSLIVRLIALLGIVNKKDFKIGKLR